MNETTELIDRTEKNTKPIDSGLYADMDYSANYSSNLPALPKHLNIPWHLRPAGRSV